MATKPAPHDDQADAPAQPAQPSQPSQPSRRQPANPVEPTQPQTSPGSPASGGDANPGTTTPATPQPNTAPATPQQQVAQAAQDRANQVTRDQVTSTSVPVPSQTTTMQSGAQPSGDARAALEYVRRNQGTAMKDFLREHPQAAWDELEAHGLAVVSTNGRVHLTTKGQDPIPSRPRQP